LAEQSNITAKRAEQCSVLQRPQLPVMRVFQSVSASLNWHEVLPPLETFVQGFDVPGKFATTQPSGTGTRQLRLSSSFSMPKLQDDSVVAEESPNGCAAAIVGTTPATSPITVMEPIPHVLHVLLMRIAHASIDVGYPATPCRGPP